MKEKTFKIWSVKHKKWFCPLGLGYTKQSRDASTYSLKDALEIVEKENSSTVNVPKVAMVESLS